MPYIERKRVVPCIGGVPVKRVHNVKCRCGHGFTIDLGPLWKKGLVIKCPKCGKVVARATDEMGFQVF